MELASYRGFPFVERKKKGKIQLALVLCLSLIVLRTLGICLGVGCCGSATGINGGTTDF